MSAPQCLLSDFDEEIASTRRFLERVPEDRLAWRPHPASATLAELASHIAELPGSQVCVGLRGRGALQDYPVS
jgi:hypothetical protein